MYEILCVWLLLILLLLLLLSYLCRQSSTVGQMREFFDIFRLIVLSKNVNLIKRNW